MPEAPDGEHLAREVERLRDEVAALAERSEMLRVRAGEAESSLRTQISYLTDENREQRRKLNAIYESKTWRLLRLASRAALVTRNPVWALRRLRARMRGAQGPPRPLASVAGTEKSTLPAIVPEYRLTENGEVRKAYERALGARRFTGTGHTRVAMAISSLDLSLGRGDVYVAVGLGRWLARLGYEVVYLPRGSWYEVPEGTGVYLALLDEVDLLNVPASCLRVAWVRNRTTEWTQSPSLAMYDAVLCSSDRSLTQVRRAYPGPMDLLRIGVDHELFNADGNDDRRHGVATTVNQWGAERQIFRSLLECTLDFPLGLYGEQRGLPVDLAPFWLGKASFFALPSLYRQAALVLDDHNHTTQSYGNLNSRVYEALACGALVLTNSSLGLHELCLTDVPVYGTSPELDRVVHDVIADPEGARAPVKSLQRRVLDEHTFERRAEQFDRLLKELRAGERASSRAVVGFYPDYRRTNPYQSMLYSWPVETGVVAVPVPEPGAVAQARIAGPRFIYHLHWTAPILGPALTEGQARKRMREFLGGVDALRGKGARFVWTIHNVLPHECKFPEIEAELDQGLADRADAIHVMCDDTPDLVAPYYHLPRDRVRVIPHPSYIDVYPNLIDQAAARAELGLLPQHTVLCFFGGIRPYKGLDSLLDAFERAADADPDLRLIVAGPPGRFADVEALRDRCAADPRIVSSFSRIGDNDIQVFMNAADVVVVPHRSVLNSGSLLLALSFGRPVIAPVSGCVRELLTPDVALTFDPGDPAALREALLRARGLKGDASRRVAYEKALRYPMKAIAESFAKTVLGFDAR